MIITSWDHIVTIGRYISVTYVSNKYIAFIKITPRSGGPYCYWKYREIETISLITIKHLTKRY